MPGTVWPRGRRSIRVALPSWRGKLRRPLRRSPDVPGDADRECGAMGVTRRIAVAPISTERFRDVLHAEDFARLEELVRRAREALEGRVVFNVSSTSAGGGVVELLRSLIGYTRGAGVDARWKVITAGPEFFDVTKRIHNRLHGFEGDGGPLGAAERRV